MASIPAYQPEEVRATTTRGIREVHLELLETRVLSESSKFKV